MHHIQDSIRDCTSDGSCKYLLRSRHQRVPRPTLGSELVQHYRNYISETVQKSKNTTLTEAGSTSREAAAGEHRALVHLQLRVGVGALQHVAHKVARRQRRAVPVHHQRQVRLWNELLLSKRALTIGNDGVASPSAVCCSHAAVAPAGANDTVHFQTHTKASVVNAELPSAPRSRHAVPAFRCACGRDAGFRGLRLVAWVRSCCAPALLEPVILGLLLIFHVCAWSSSSGGRKR